MYQADGSGGIPNMENAGSKKQKKVFEKDETIITYLSYLRGPKLPELKEEDEPMV